MTRSPVATPPAEVEIDTAVVRRLLVAQHPDLSELPIEMLDGGWDNAMFRLGAEWVVRLPRRAAAVGLLEPLARFLRCLHVRAPDDAPASAVRGVPLAQRAAVVEPRLQRLESRTPLVTPAVWRAWQRSLEAPWEGESTWIHGDLHARNVLVHDGAISAIVDWGDMASGDKATDLAAIWMLLPSKASRRKAMAAYGDTSAALWARARGWAVLFGALLLESGLEDHPRHARMGELTLCAVT